MLRCYISPAWFWLGARVPGGPVAMGNGWNAGGCGADEVLAEVVVVGVAFCAPGLEALTRWIVWSFSTL